MVIYRERSALRTARFLEEEALPPPNRLMLGSTLVLLEDHAAFLDFPFLFLSSSHFLNSPRREDEEEEEDEVERLRLDIFFTSSLLRSKLCFNDLKFVAEELEFRFCNSSARSRSFLFFIRSERLRAFFFDSRFFNQVSTCVFFVCLDIAPAVEYTVLEG